jgi:hypothetical protein
MIARKLRRPPGKVMYAIFWIGAVWIGLGFLGSLPNLIADFQREKSSAFEVLAGEMIVLAIGVSCVVEIINANKARREQRTEARPETGAASPEPLQLSPPISSPPEQASSALLNQLKEELFSLESDRVSGKITPEEYSEAKAALETRLILATGVAIPESIPPVPLAPEQEQAPTITKRTSLWVTVPILAVLCWIAFLVYRRDGISAYSVGEVIGTLLVPFLIAYAVAGARRRRNWATFSIVFFAVGILLSGATNQKSLTSLSRSDMLRELSGTKPLEDNLPENEKEMASVTKAVFADLRASDKSQNEQIGALKPYLGKLYSNDSFSSVSAMQKTVDSIDKAWSLDRETNEMIDRLPDSVRTRLDKTNLSESDKSSFLKAFLSSFNSAEYVSARRQVMATESDWVGAVEDLYSFSMQHSPEIIVRDNTIGIAREATRSKFNQRLLRAEDLHKSFLAATKRAEELRAATLKAQGISESDMGLSK